MRLQTVCYIKGFIKVQDCTECQVVKLIFLLVFFVVFYRWNGKCSIYIDSEYMDWSILDFIFIK